MTGDAKDHNRNRKKRGFQRASSLLQTRIRKAGETRGFAVTRLLTHWPEIVGEQTASIARPVNVSYSKGGFGATLTVLTTGANAPMLQAELPKIRDKVNACYGYAAIARIRITQTAPTGFHEGRASFEHARKPSVDKSPEITQAARELSADTRDDKLRSALEILAANVLSRAKSSE
ncbi:DUF721 domain-containing protein [Aliiroseovarius sp. PTFE2010]|uniref:DUF721 domain-containing protein n=1 Tax=Aliiroseovarius sp. PTFE2010 TaxID=3417190 RepID=UPI003CF6E2A2